MAFRFPARRRALALILGLAALPGLTASAAAQAASQPTGTSGRGGDGVVATTAIDVSRLPVDLRRIERQFRRTTIREERDGLNLRYFVDVYATAPPIVLFTPQDNLLSGPVPYGAPTHYDMLEMMTPQEFRGSTLMLRSGIGVPRKSKDKR
jgi:hypothetical protein